MIRILDKLFLFAFSLVVLLISAAAIGSSTGWLKLDPIEAYPQYVPATVIGVSVVMILIAIRFLVLALRRSRSGAPSIDQRTEFGDIRISIETVENLALKAASRVRGVKDLRARVRVSDAGLDIAIRTVVDGESSIPALTEEVQSQVKGHLEDITGIPVAFVSVYVANIVQTNTFKSRVE